MDINLIDILNDFRKMKISYDIERFKLMSYQLENLINDYNEMIKSREEIQEKYFDVMNDLNENGLDTEVDYGRWGKVRSNEIEEWKSELDELYTLKYEIDETLELLKNGEIERMLIEEEERLTGDKIKK
jgi:hypothetical protein